MIRVSFRKGGDKSFYAVLRRSLLAKGWEVCIHFFTSHKENLMVSVRQTLAHLRANYTTIN